MQFAINHMTVANLGFDEFVSLARDLNCVGVELRNDLPAPLFDGLTPQDATTHLQDMPVLALAEVTRFNDWSDDKRQEAETLIATASAIGARAISLIPRNDNSGMGNGERQANLRLALRELAPMLQEAGLIGLVEPLGFAACALRTKAEAVEAIEALGATGTFQLVHDTFHHHLSGEDQIFAAHTGIVHVSGVTDPALSIHDMQDLHRVLIDAADRLGNINQLKDLVNAGYNGPVSFEAFSPDIHSLPAPQQALADSIHFIRTRLAAIAA